METHVLQRLGSNVIEFFLFWRLMVATIHFYHQLLFYTYKICYIISYYELSAETYSKVLPLQYAPQTTLCLRRVIPILICIILQ